MTALLRNKILIGFLIPVCILLTLSGTYNIYQHKAIQHEHSNNLEWMKSLRESLGRENELVLMSDIKDMEIKNLSDALETALKDNMVIQTLLNKDMEEWTPTGILAMRDELASLPYGSPFDSGHIITGAYGSTALSGSYWKDNGHTGIDIFPNSGNINEIVRSVIDGRVVTWGRNDRVYGNYLVIESLDGQYQIKYAHLSSIAIFSPDGKMDLYEGMEFPEGTRIAKMGNTGKTTGNDNEGHHLHVEYSIRESNSWRLLNASAIIDYIGKSDN